MSTATKSRPKKKAKAKSVKRLNAADKLAIIKKEATEREHLKDLACNYAKRKSEWEASKAETKNAKQDMDAAFLALYEAAKPGGDSMLPFEPQPELEQSAAPPAPGDSTDADKAAFDAATIREILTGIPGAKITALEDDGVKTGADLQKWFAAHPRRKIAGIGEQAEEKINEAMATWWEKHQHPNGNGAATAPTNVDKPVIPADKSATDGPKHRKIKIDLGKELKRRIKLAGYESTGIADADNDVTLKLVRNLGDNPAIDTTSVFTIAALEGMAEKLGGLDDAAVGEIIGVK
jgi:hypothetical protein